MKEKQHDKHENYDTVILNSALILIKEHKERCNNPDCGISTYAIYELLKRAGIETEVTPFL